MWKCYFNRMQQLPFNPRLQPPIFYFVAVKFIPNNRIAQVRRMHAYLMSATSFNLKLNYRERPLVLQNFPMRNRLLPTRLNYSHPLSIPFLAPD
jgi:hypothetical protein